MGEAVVFLASGGLDSTVGMVKALQEHQAQRIYPLYIKRGSRAQEQELRCLNDIMLFLQKNYYSRVLPLAFADLNFPPANWKRWYNLKEIERLGYPMRDIILQSVAVQYAEYLNSIEMENIKTVMVGQTSDEVIPHASNQALTLASYLMQLDRDDEAWSVSSPLLWPEPMTKAETLRWGLDHEVPVELTWSCFKGGVSPCGKCQECKRRDEAMKAIGLGA